MEFGNALETQRFSGVMHMRVKDLIVSMNPLPIYIDTH